MKPINWNITGSAPDFSSSNQLAALGNNNIIKGLESLATTAKTYGDKRTADNTQELLGMLSQAKTPEELDSTVNKLMQFGQTNMAGNYDKAALNKAVDNRPVELMQKNMASDVYTKAKLATAESPNAVAAMRALSAGDTKTFGSIFNTINSPTLASDLFTLGQNNDNKNWDRLNQQEQNDIQRLRIEDEALQKEAERRRRAAEYSSSLNGGNSGGGVSTSSGSGSGGSTVLPSEGNGRAGDRYYNVKDGFFEPSEVTTNSGSVPITGRDATVAYMADTMSKYESKKPGPHYPRDPTRTASGTAGLTKGTAQRIINKNLPALSKEFGMNANQLYQVVLNETINPAAYRRIIEKGLNMEVDALEEKGTPVNPATVRLAWWQGGGGAQTILNNLKTNPNMLMDTVIKGDWAASQKQPKWKGMTISQYAKIVENQVGYKLDGTPLNSGDPNSQPNVGIPFKVITDLQAKIAAKIAADKNNPTASISATDALKIDSDNSALWSKMSPSNQRVYNEFIADGKLNNLTAGQRNALFTRLKAVADNSSIIDTDKESRDIIDSFVKDRDSYTSKETAAKYRQYFDEAKIALIEQANLYKLDPAKISDAAIARILFPLDYLTARGNDERERRKLVLQNTVAERKMAQTKENNKPRPLQLATKNDTGIVLRNAQVSDSAISRAAIQNERPELVGDNPFAATQPVTPAPNPRAVLNAAVAKAKAEETAKTAKLAADTKAKAAQEARTKELLALQQAATAKAKAEADLKAAKAKIAAAAKAAEKTFIAPKPYRPSNFRDPVLATDLLNNPNNKFNMK